MTQLNMLENLKLVFKSPQKLNVVENKASFGVVDAFQWSLINSFNRYFDGIIQPVPFLYT